MRGEGADKEELVVEGDGVDGRALHVLQVVDALHHERLLRRYL